uniref:Gustatory receptor GR68.3 n=1 Tax=Lobesia botrana TaxID=209534 RepID=A0A345BEZ3_9NEOP|nr:gustatory receptor GR68.3 [Lobesia botrana]
MEIQHFATLMSFRKAVITVYDYFSLDANLLFGMIATVVTYLVILVQFDNS